MAKFINPFTDIGFKRIFGQEISKPVLIAFLNALLDGERKIVDLQYLDKEQPGEATSVQYEYFLYWDLGVEGYRTFKASRLIEYLAIENSDEQL